MVQERRKETGKRRQGSRTERNEGIGKKKEEREWSRKERSNGKEKGKKGTEWKGIKEGKR